MVYLIRSTASQGERENMEDNPGSVKPAAEARLLELMVAAQLIRAQLNPLNPLEQPLEQPRLMVKPWLASVSEPILRAPDRFNKSVDKSMKDKSMKDKSMDKSVEVDEGDEYEDNFDGEMISDKAPPIHRFLRPDVSRRFLDHCPSLWVSTSPPRMRRSPSSTWTFSSTRTGMHTHITYIMIMLYTYLTPIKHLLNPHYTHYTHNTHNTQLHETLRRLCSHAPHEHSGEAAKSRGIRTRCAQHPQKL
jgi:hypothetical protein